MLVEEAGLSVSGFFLFHQALLMATRVTWVTALLQDAPPDIPLGLPKYTEAALPVFPVPCVVPGLGSGLEALVCLGRL